MFKEEQEDQCDGMEWAKGRAGGDEIIEQQWGHVDAAFSHGKDLGFYLSVGCSIEHSS